MKLSEYTIGGVVLCGFGVAIAVTRPGDFGVTDFVQYWTAVRLLLAGEAVYDPAAVQAVQQALPIRHFPILMWNPPFILPLFMWCGFIPFQIAASVWMTLSVLFVVWALVLVCKTFYLERPTRNLAVLSYVCTLYPIVLLLFYGQISSLLLLSFVGFLYLTREQEHVLDSYPAGLILGLGLVKPHLLWLLYGFLGVNSIKKKLWKTLLGMATTLCVLSLVVFCFSPQTYWSYLNSWAAAPIYWKTPTVGSWLQEFAGRQSPWIRLAPTLVAMLGFGLAFWGTEIAANRKNCAYLVPFSLLLSPYGWVYDQLLLLPCYCIFVCGKKRFAVSLVLLANLAMLLFTDQVGQQWMIWYPCVFAGLVLAEFSRTAAARIRFEYE